ncbi:MAG: hypothetical protein ABFC71_04975 [Methanoregula sp.]
MAQVFSIVFLLITVSVMNCIYKITKGNEIIVLIYGMIFFIDGYLNTQKFNDALIPPAIYWIILILSVILFGATLLTRKEKPILGNEKTGPVFLTQKPFMIQLLIIGVFLCFVLFMFINFISYEKETDSYLYLIEINPDAPLYNVTFMVPFPLGPSQNITNIENLNGNFPPYFMNYTQSIVDTENGKMIKITADTIEKQNYDVVEEPVRLYQRFPVSNSIDSSFPLDHEPVLLPKFSLTPSSCSDKNYQRDLIGKMPLNCSVYGSKMYAAFDTVPTSQTTITVYLEGTRMISSSINPRREGYQDSISTNIYGGADGWNSASGSLLSG